MRHNKKEIFAIESLAVLVATVVDRSATCPGDEIHLTFCIKKRAFDFHFIFFPVAA